MQRSNWYWPRLSFQLAVPIVERCSKIDVVVSNFVSLSIGGVEREGKFDYPYLLTWIQIRAAQIFETVRKIASACVRWSRFIACDVVAELMLLVLLFPRGFDPESLESDESLPPLLPLSSQAKRKKSISWQWVMIWPSPNHRIIFKFPLYPSKFFGKYGLPLPRYGLFMLMDCCLTWYSDEKLNFVL